MVHMSQKHAEHVVFIAIYIKCKAEIYTRAGGVATKAKLDRATCVGSHRNWP